MAESRVSPALATLGANGWVPDESFTRESVDPVTIGELPIVSTLANTSRRLMSAVKRAWAGDSTTLGLAATGDGGAAGVNAYFLAKHVTPPGGLLYGSTDVFFGSNGDTLARFLINATPGYGISDVIAAAPNLIILSYGINDVRIQASAPSEDTLVSMLKQAVNRLRAALPNADIVLRMPNSFLTTDVGSFGFVVPNGWAQGASTLLRNAYRRLKNYWPNVVVYDAQATLFPETSPATFTYMTNQVHPSVQGYQKIQDQIAALIASSVYNEGRAADAVATSYGEAHVTYPNVVLNGDYVLIASGIHATQGDGFIRFLATDGLASLGKFQLDDIVWQNGEAAFTMSNGVVAANSSGNIQLGSLGSGIPTYAQTAGTEVRVYRNKNRRMAAAKDYVNAGSYPVCQAFGVSAAGSNFIQVSGLASEPDSTVFNIRSTDTLIHPTLGAVALTSATFTNVAPNKIQIGLAATDFTMPAGYGVVVIAGPGADRPRTQVPPMITFEQAGALVDGTFKKETTRGGLYSRVRATLGVAGTSTTTAVLARNGTTFLTITWANGVTGQGTLAWASGSSANIIGDAQITMTMTKGTGSPADLAIALDV